MVMTLVYRTLNFWLYGFRKCSSISNGTHCFLYMQRNVSINTHLFRKSSYYSLDLFPSSGEKVGSHPLSWVRMKELISITGSVSVLRGKGGEASSRLGPIERTNLNHWICFHPQGKCGDSPTNLCPLERATLNQWIGVLHKVKRWGFTCSFVSVRKR
jgi:hypothetical protein